MDKYTFQMIGWPPFLVEVVGKAGPIFLYYTPDMGGFTQVSIANYRQLTPVQQDLQTYNYVKLFYGLICCIVELAVNSATLVLTH